MKKRFSFRNWTCMVLMTLIPLGLAGWYGTTYVGAEEKKFLADRHQTKGIACASCHKESPPKADVTTAVCFSCHGSYAKIAEKTINIAPNPHVSHMGELSCESCHHAHKPSENRCADCHASTFKVP
jgi:hypothetical protein